MRAALTVAAAAALMLVGASVEARAAGLPSQSCLLKFMSGTVSP